MFQHSLLVSITHEWKNVLSIETNINFIQKLDFSNGFFDFMAPEGRSKDYVGYVEGLEWNCNVIFVLIRIGNWVGVLLSIWWILAADIDCLRWGERPPLTKTSKDVLQLKAQKTRCQDGLLFHSVDNRLKGDWITLRTATAWLLNVFRFHTYARLCSICRRREMKAFEIEESNWRWHEHPHRCGWERCQKLTEFAIFTFEANGRRINRKVIVTSTHDRVRARILDRNL